MKQTFINEIGTIDTSNTYLRGGLIEVHIPVNEASDEMAEVLDKCVADFLEKHPTVPEEKIFFDIGIAYNVGEFVENIAPEFSLSIIAWEEDEEIKDNGAVEFYEEIPITFTAEDKQKMIEIICDAFRKTVMK